MRVLHLAPPSADIVHITAHSFIDEEILALQSAGVDVATVSDAVARPTERRGVPVVPVGPAVSAHDLESTLAFAARHLWSLPTGAVWTPREVLHAVRIELTAARAVKEMHADVVHSHFGWPAGLGGVLAAAEADVPLVASLRGMDLLLRPEIGYGLRRDPTYDNAVRQLLGAASRTVYASEYMRGEGVRLGAPTAQAIVIRKGVDLARFHPAANRPAARRAIGVSGPMVLAVGSLVRRKGIDLLLDVMALLRDRPWTLVVCGDGDERGALETLASALGIADRVRLVGAVDRGDIGRFFAAADVFVHVAVAEAAGNVVLEALAAGCPIVCTDAGGPREYVADGSTGFVVPRERHAIADRVGALLASAALRGSMSRAARAAAELQYSYNRMIADLVAVYEQAIAESAATAHAGADGRVLRHESVA